MNKTRFTVGRDISADIPIADQSVSRIHAEISLVEGDRLFVTDCQSSNGTFVLRDGSERRITQEKVLPTDRIKFGGIAIAAADLLSAVRRIAGPVQTPAGGDPGKKKGKRAAFATSAKLIRCSCGAIKAAGEQCPSCGH